ncbi:hypothetical protein CCHR01_01131 [Colletotrichum chrysophilum]|uniref:Uncharacterized protein n=1 Tax=Colletotrichum chrysophilum TaxID=1836956 RepID=A0AAD9B2K7_9PEZI|nr:hypothetical protein CCHR01_01131 [Colletotrichum chrysophilum]
MPKQFHGGPRRRLDLQIPDALLQLFCTSPVSVRMLQTSNKQTQAIRASRTQSIQYRHHPDEPAHQSANNLHSRRSSKSPQSLFHTPDSPRLDPVDGQPAHNIRDFGEEDDEEVPDFITSPSDDLDISPGSLPLMDSAHTADFNDPFFSANSHR